MQEKNSNKPSVNNEQDWLNGEFSEMSIDETEEISATDKIKSELANFLGSVFFIKRQEKNKRALSDIENAFTTIVSTLQESNDVIDMAIREALAWYLSLKKDLQSDFGSFFPAFFSAFHNI